MKRNLLLLSAACLSAVAASAQTSGPIRVKSGFTADVVVEGLPAEDYLVGGIDNSSVGLYSKTVKPVNRGIPAEMPLKSFETGSLYNIDYTKNNALRLVGPADSEDLNLPDDGTLTLATPVKTDTLYFLAICGNGPTDLYVEVTYSDGNISSETVTVEDWWNTSTDSADHKGKDEAFWGLDRIDRNTDTPQGTNAVRVLEKYIETNAEKEIKSVYFQKTDASQGYPSIFGLSAGQTPIEVADGFNADIVAEAYPIADYATIALDRNAWVLYSAALELNDTETTYGLPDDGNIVTTTSHTYVMDYTKLNATRLTVDNPTETLELEDIPTCSYDGSIYVLATAGNGPASLDLTFNYEDGTTSTESISVIDWCNHQSDAVVQTGRYYDGSIDDRDFVGLYESEIVPDMKPIQSVTITNTATSGASKGIVLGFYLTDGSIVTGVDRAIADAEKQDGSVYNIAGQRVNSSYKGIVIKNGKKYIAR